MAQYSKAIVAIVMMLALFLKAGFGIDWNLDQASLQTWIDTGIALFTPIFVYLFPNKATGGATLRSPAIVTGFAFALSLAAVIALSACATVSANTWQGRIDGARQDLHYVGLGMVVYATLPPCGSPGVQGLCSSPRVLDMWDAGETAALTGLAAVEKLVKEGATEQEITAAWVEALAEVVRMQNLLRNSTG